MYLWYPLHITTSTLHLLNGVFHQPLRPKLGLIAATAVQIIRTTKMKVREKRSEFTGFSGVRRAARRMKGKAIGKEGRREREMRRIIQVGRWMLMEGDALRKRRYFSFSLDKKKQKGMKKNGNDRKNKKRMIKQKSNNNKKSIMKEEESMKMNEKRNREKRRQNLSCLPSLLPFFLSWRFFSSLLVFVVFLFFLVPFPFFFFITVSLSLFVFYSIILFLFFLLFSIYIYIFLFIITYHFLFFIYNL